MSTEGKCYWVFINLKHQIKSKKMSQSRADKMIQMLHPSEVSEWLAWCPLFRDWIPLQNLIKEKQKTIKFLIKLREEFIENTSEEKESMESSRVQNNMFESNPDPNHKTTIPEGYAHLEDVIEEVPLQSSDFVGDDLNLSNIPKPPNLSNLYVDENERRTAPRYEVRFEALIMSHGRSFKTYTINISESGALLEQPIPQDFARSVLEVVFLLKLNTVTEKFAIQGKVLSHRENLKYLTFNISTPENKKGFERLMMLYFQGK